MTDHTRLRLRLDDVSGGPFVFVTGEGEELSLSRSDFRERAGRSARALLNRCRAGFAEWLDAQQGAVVGSRPAQQVRATTLSKNFGTKNSGKKAGWWQRWVESWTADGAWNIGALKPAGALTLIAIGFFAARLTSF